MLGEHAVITLLLTDIEGSTRLWEEDPQAMAAALVIHDAVAQEAITQHGGTLVKPRGEGDSLFIVFSHPLDAVLCSADLQRALGAQTWPTPRPIRSRMAIHTGVVNHWEGDYYGQTVNRCARIRGVGHGGQVLVSHASLVLVQKELPKGFALVDLGFHRLKDLAQPEQIFQLSHDDLRAEFPPLASLGAESTNLPFQTSSFVGRSEELVHVAQLLQKSPVVSLVALSGMGKSRLGLQSAADHVDRFPDGVWYFDASLIGPGRLLETLAQHFGIELRDSQEVAEVAAGLKAKKTLILLDNVDASHDYGPIVHALLRSCPQLRFLVTASAKLGVPGEAIYGVPALRCPPGSGASPRDIEEADATRLFVERAQLVKPTFTLHAGNAGLIANIVRQLDGHALGIELAAARLKSLSLDELASRLQADLRMAGGGASGQLTQILDWAWAAMNSPEQKLLGSLSVFRGPFSLAAAEAISPNDEIQAEDIIDLIDDLVERGLVQFQEQEGRSTYRVLKPVREHALKNVSDRATMEAAHAAYFGRLAIAEHTEHEGSDFKRYLAEIEFAIDNVRAALEWYAEHESGDLPQLCAALFRYWEARGLAVEGRRWCQLALERVGEEVSSAVGDAANALGCFEVRCGQYESAKATHERALQIREALGDQKGIAGSLNNLANIENESGNLAEAMALYSRAIEINRELGNDRYVAINLVNLGTTAHRLREYEKSLQYHRESEQAFAKLGSRAGRLYPLASMGNALSSLHRHEEAEAAYREAAALCREFEERPWMCICLEGMSAVYLAKGVLDGFAACRAAAAALRAELDMPPSPSDAEESQELLDRAKSKFGDSAVSSANQKFASVDWKAVAGDWVWAPS